jgi:purine catabolism regulator
VSATPLQGLALGELLDGDLGLELLVGDEAARERRIAGAHSIEIEHPATWLGRDWIMLTTGVRLRHSARAQRELVAELDEIGAAALGFGVELAFKRVPAALLAEARARNLPVFSIPLRTPFRDVVSAVNGALLSAEVRAMQRLSSLQLFLMDALEEEDPRRAVIGRLAEFVGATVTLFAADGQVIDATGPAHVEAIWREITARPAALVQFEHDGGETIATPLGRDTQGACWLAVSSPRAQPAARVTRAAARATAPMLAALSRLDTMAEAQERAIRAGILDALLGEGRDPDQRSLAARAAAVGLDWAAPAAVVLVGAGRGEEARAALEAELHARALPFLASTRPDACAVLLVQAPAAPLHAAVRAVLERLPDAAAGIGRPVDDVAAVPASLRDAEIALRRAPAGSLLAFEELDLATLMATEVAAEGLAPKVEGLLAELRRHRGLYEAVVAYFAHDLDVMRAAEAMHLHHNSLRYRLGRVEHVLGRSLKDPALIASLYIALAAGGDDEV